MSVSAENERPPGDESLRLLCAVGRALDQQLDDALHGCGSEVEQWRVLGLVARGGATMSALAEHALLLAPRATKLVDRMAAANLVHRRPDAAVVDEVLARLHEASVRATAPAGLGAAGD